ncbi:cytochrome b/b6 domain-containing protein [Acuticoccus sp. MNP-M23]|uniref:cytochrome b n=1 Tax=Acuticoccus sp. MNP-M23 TaxID=3072793 RepID=UPI0028152A42|nr:cytochrome b/b6 domain-containing protein [Acuticoccus sp. MNP-M23]WMS41913.1 cytochrome b/b6 domain-containing protein [Acuticoccus sp. MNP-M23]
MTNSTSVATHERWTSLSIWLHWLIVLLLLAQFAEGEFMGDLFDKGAAGVSEMTALLGYVHIGVGAIIFLAAAVRLWDRFAHGRPAAPEGEPNWAKTLARISHALLYAILLAMPVAGFVAWFFGSELLAELHKWAWDALMVIAGIHVLGALVNQFWFKTGVLTRILPGHGRST